jgi:osmotically inducible protein OsmC
MYSGIKPLATISASSTGGRNGHSATSDGGVDVKLSVPKEMGGPGLAGTVTPEHLFAAGYAACFGGALDVAAKRDKGDATKAVTVCTVSVGPRDEGGYGIAVKMKITDPSVPTADLKKWVDFAHEHICPYSHATRGNIPLDFEVVGA